MGSIIFPIFTVVVTRLNVAEVVSIPNISLFSAAVSFIVAEQFGDAIEMKAITKAARYLCIYLPLYPLVCLWL